jgi:hypothetical protein
MKFSSFWILFGENIKISYSVKDKFYPFPISGKKVS